MGYILGFSAFFHDSSACLVKDGVVIAAAPEERFSRMKHDSGFPENAIGYCLAEAGIAINDLEEVVFYEKPFTKFERILDMFVQGVPRGFLPFRKAMLGWFRDKFWTEDYFRKSLHYKGRFTYCQHHLAHAFLACTASNFNNAAYVVIDGVGERACTTYGILNDAIIKPLGEQRYPHSIGLFYSAFTQYCGFKVNSGEYKLMGLAPYGDPVFADLIRDKFISMDTNGVVQLHTANYGFPDELRMINKRFEQVLGRKARKPEDPIDEFYKNVAASVQLVTEELVMKLLRFVAQTTGETNVVLGGGVALNCVINAQIIQQSPFQQVFVHSASGDSGCAMGAALWAASGFGTKRLPPSNPEFLGPGYATEAILKALTAYGEIRYTTYSYASLFPLIAEELASGKVVGWFQGRMENGPRALGNRSILASASDPEMKQKLNLKIKKREGFRPFAPVVTAAAFDTYFVDRGYDYSRMLYVAEARCPDQIPACVHVDGTARVQRLERAFNEPLYELLEEMERQTGLPVLINTSFNERGEPVVCSPTDALKCFFNTETDVLVMEEFVIFKAENTHISYQQLEYEPD